MGVSGSGRFGTGSRGSGDAPQWRRSGSACALLAALGVYWLLWLGAPPVGSGSGSLAGVKARSWKIRHLAGGRGRRAWVPGAGGPWAVAGRAAGPGGGGPGRLLRTLRAAGHPAPEPGEEVVSPGLAEGQHLRLGEGAGAGWGHDGGRGVDPTPPGGSPRPTKGAETCGSSPGVLAPS